MSFCLKLLLGFICCFEAGGTIMMSGRGILTNGKGTRREYGEFNLDELVVSDLVLLISTYFSHLLRVFCQFVQFLLQCLVLLK